MVILGVCLPTLGGGGDNLKKEKESLILWVKTYCYSSRFYIPVHSGVAVLSDLKEKTTILLLFHLFYYSSLSLFLN